MKGVVFPGNRMVEINTFPDPTPGPGDVVIEIKASGMCGSDLHVYRSPEGGPGAAAALGLGGDGQAVIAGHEPCGVIVARGSQVLEKNAPIGSRVMVHHYDGCGVCSSCRGGWAQLCKSGFIVYGVTGNGAHAPYMCVPASTLVALPENLTFEAGAAISCGTGTAFSAMCRMAMPGGSTLAIFGQGPVGLSATMFGKSMGLKVIAIDISADRLNLSRAFGADELVDPKSEDPIEILHEITGGIGVDYALECSGQPSARQKAVRSTRTWGTACFVGEGKDVTLDVSSDILRRQLTLIGSWTFNTGGQEECAKFVSKHNVPVNALFTHRYSQNEAQEAYKLFDTQTTGKGVFIF